ncbi:MAG: hypothetical protein KDJ87_18200 [Rhizobiaceae bacterium]|nr:hypothetical protein [Rhizobiaceae bacterium]
MISFFAHDRIALKNLDATKAISSPDAATGARPGGAASRRAFRVETKETENRGL